jgi:hypothetical protein
MEITLKVRPTIASELQAQRARSSQATDLLELTRKLGVSIRPTHPGTADPGLSSYFTLESGDEDAIQGVLEQLRANEGVEAAYVKPRDELP